MAQKQQYPKRIFFPKLRFTRPAWITAVFLAQALLQTLMMKIIFKLFLPSKSFPLIHRPAWEGRKCRSLKNDLSAPMRAVRQACSQRHTSGEAASAQRAKLAQVRWVQVGRLDTFIHLVIWEYAVVSDWLVVGHSAGVSNFEMSWFRTEVSIKQDTEHVFLVQSGFNIHIIVTHQDLRCCHSGTE